MRFPLLGLARDLHPLANAHAERTTKIPWYAIQLSRILSWFAFSNLYSIKVLVFHLFPDFDILMLLFYNLFIPIVKIEVNQIRMGKQVLKNKA